MGGGGGGPKKDDIKNSGPHTIYSLDDQCAWNHKPTKCILYRHSSIQMWSKIPQYLRQKNNCSGHKAQIFGIVKHRPKFKWKKNVCVTCWV
jgi:hypothetical protein